MPNNNPPPSMSRDFDKSTYYILYICASAIISLFLLAANYFDYLKFGIVFGGGMLLYVYSGSSVYRKFDYFKEINLSKILMVLSLLIIYLLLRYNVSEFALSIGDASAYLWDGVHAFITNEDTGFFPPMAAAVSALGFGIFGLENVSIIFVLYSLVSLIAIYFIINDWVNSSTAGLTAVAFLTLSPLHIWFSKTTFSESIWQVIILTSITMLLMLRGSKFIDRGPLVVLGFCVFLSCLTRGTSVFLAAVIIISFYGLRSLNNKQKFIYSLYVWSLFAIGFSIALRLRSDYLIGWQFSKVLGDVSSQILALVVISTLLLLISFLSLATNLLIKHKALITRSLIIFALILTKVFFAFVISDKQGSKFIDVVVINEFTYMIWSFSEVGIAVLLIACLWLLTNALKGSEHAFIIMVAYILFSIPLQLQSQFVNANHEMLFYWHRYYFSEIYILSMLALVAFSYSSITIALKLTHRFKPNTIDVKSLLEVAVSIIIVFFFTNYSLIKTVYSKSYLSGSANLVNWIKDISSDRPVYAYFSEMNKYGGYDMKYLLGELKRYGVDLYVNEVAEIKGELPSDSIIICSTQLKCHEDKHLERVSSYSGEVGWNPHIIEQEKLPYSKMLFDLEAFRTYPNIELGSKITVKNDLANFFSAYEILHEGWYEIERSHVWSTEKASISLPLPSDCKSTKCELVLNFSVYGASAKSPKNVNLTTKDTELVIANYGASSFATIPVSRKLDKIDIDLFVPSAVSPSGTESRDNRVLGIALHSFEFRLSD